MMTVEQLVKRLKELFPEEFQYKDLDCLFEIINDDEICMELGQYHIELDCIETNLLDDYDVYNSSSFSQYNDVKNIGVKTMTMYSNYLVLFPHSQPASDILKDLDKIESLYFSDLDFCKKFISTHTDLPRKMYFYRGCFTFYKVDTNAIEIEDITRATMNTEISFTID